MLRGSAEPELVAAEVSSWRKQFTGVRNPADQWY